MVTKDNRQLVFVDAPGLTPLHLAANVVSELISSGARSETPCSYWLALLTADEHIMYFAVAQHRHY